MTARRLLTAAFGLAALAFVIYGAYAWYRSYRQVSTDDAYVEGAIATVSAKVSGQVIDLFVRDNQSVKQGEVLARIDPRDYAVKVEHARAAVAIAQSQYRAAGERVVLGRARALATYAGWIAGTTFRDHQIFDPHAVAPRNIEVVFVDQARALAHSQRRQAHIGRPSCQFR